MQMNKNWKTKTMHAPTQGSPLCTSFLVSLHTHMHAYTFLIKWDHIIHIFLWSAFFSHWSSLRKDKQAGQEGSGGWGRAHGLHMEGTGPALPHPLAVMQRLGRGGGRYLEKSKVRQGFRISKHFPNNRVAVSRGSPSSQLRRDYFSISVHLWGLNRAVFWAPVLRHCLSA